jgi:hypothetical protein
MLGRISEVVVCGEQGQLVPSTELNQECVDRSELYTGPAAGVAYFGGCNVVCSVWRDDWQGPKAFNNRRCGARSIEAL